MGVFARSLARRWHRWACFFCGEGVSCGCAVARREPFLPCLCLSRPRRRLSSRSMHIGGPAFLPETLSFAATPSPMHTEAAPLLFLGLLCSLPPCNHPTFSHFYLSIYLLLRPLSSSSTQHSLF